MPDLSTGNTRAPASATPEVAVPVQGAGVLRLTEEENWALDASKYGGGDRSAFESAKQKLFDARNQRGVLALPEEGGQGEAEKRSAPQGGCAGLNTCPTCRNTWDVARPFRFVTMEHGGGYVPCDDPWHDQPNPADAEDPDLFKKAEAMCQRLSREVHAHYDEESGTWDEEGADAWQEDLDVVGGLFNIALKAASPPDVEAEQGQERCWYCRRYGPATTCPACLPSPPDDVLRGRVEGLAHCHRTKASELAENAIFTENADAARVFSEFSEFHATFADEITTALAEPVPVRESDSGERPTAVSDSADEPSGARASTEEEIPGDSLIGIKSCGCMVSWAIASYHDDGETVDKWLDEGYTVQAADLDDVRDWLAPCDCAATGTPAEGDKPQAVPDPLRASTCPTCGGFHPELMWVIPKSDRGPSFAALDAVGDREAAYLCPDPFHTAPRSTGGEK